MDEFSKPKIVWKRVGSILRFSFDDKGCMALDSTCFAVGNHIKYLVAICCKTPQKLAQEICPKAIFSHETTLFLNGYSDQVPFVYTISVPHGYVSKTLSENYDVKHVAKETSEKGITIAKSELGNNLKVYNIERTLCELLHKPSELNKERFIPALQAYMKSKEKDVLLLMEFAKMFCVEKRILPYLEAIQ